MKPWVVVVVACVCVASTQCGGTQTPLARAPSPTTTRTDVIMTPYISQNAIDPEAVDVPYAYHVFYHPFESQGQHLRIAYIDVMPGRANGRTVLLLHDLDFSADAWGATIAWLIERGYRVIAPDQLGCGKSSKPLHYQYSFAALAELTRGLLTSLGLEHASVVGHGMGAMLAVRYALSFPELVDKLVLVNPLGLEDYARALPYKTIDARYAAELARDPDSIRAQQREDYYGGQWTQVHEQLARLLVGMSLHTDYARVAWSRALLTDMIFTQPVLHELSQLRVATGLVIGTRDQFAPGKALAPSERAAQLQSLAQLGPRARDAIPGAQLIALENVGHVPFVEAFEAYRDALTQLLE